MQGTCSLYGRAPMPARPQSDDKDKPTYTILYIAAGVLAAALVVMVCVLRWRSNAARDEFIRIGREKRAADGRGNYEEARATEVKSPKQTIELKEIQRAVVDDRLGIQAESLEEMVRYETSMSPRQRITLQDAGTQLTETSRDLHDPTTSELPSVVDRAQISSTGIQGSINGLVDQLKRVFSSKTQNVMEETTRAADSAGKAYENLAEDRDEDKPFEFEEEW